MRHSSGRKREMHPYKGCQEEETKIPSCLSDGENTLSIHNKRSNYHFSLKKKKKGSCQPSPGKREARYKGNPWKACRKKKRKKPVTVTLLQFRSTEKGARRNSSPVRKEKKGRTGRTHEESNASWGKKKKRHPVPYLRKRKKKKKMLRLGSH